MTFDQEGQELADLYAARQVAVREARTLICEGVMDGTVDLQDRVEVQDGAGNTVA